jgi:hypothetical protein
MIMTTTSIQTVRAPWRIALWTLQVLDAAAFGTAGTAKLLAVPMMIALFDQLGFGQWFRVVTGSVEIIGALALLYPRFAALGGLWLGTTMFFGVLTHLFILHTNPAPALILGFISFLIAYLRRNELVSIVRQVLGRR